MLKMGNRNGYDLSKMIDWMTILGLIAWVCIFAAACSFIYYCINTTDETNGWYLYTIGIFLLVAFLFLIGVIAIGIPKSWD